MITKNNHILIVEDDKYSAMILNEFLKNENLKITNLKNGLSALDFLSNNDVDLILMDIRMPLLDGIETTESIRQMGINTPIIMQTACVSFNDNHRSFEAGCNEFIIKPIRSKELLNLVDKYLNQVYS